MTEPIVVVGGAGNMGSRAVRSLLEQGHDVLVADVRPPPVEGAAFAEADAGDEASVRRVAEGARLVMNFAGPYYLLGDAVARAAIALGLPYLDICDDAEATEQLLELDDEARAAGSPLVIGAGSSPGLVNALALCVAAGFDSLETLMLAWVVGEKGPTSVAPLRHFFYGITRDIPVWIDGARELVPAFTPESAEEFPFQPPLGPYVVRDVGHPETVTLPRALDVREVRNKGAVPPRRSTEIYDLLRRLGLLGDGTVTVKGTEVVARDFVAEFLTKRHNDRAGDAADDVMGLGVRAVGTVGGETTTRWISTAGHMTMAEATALPAAAAVPQLLDGSVEPGANGPEALDVGAWFKELSRIAPDAYTDIEVWQDDGPRVATSLDELARVNDTGDLLASGA